MIEQLGGAAVGLRKKYISQRVLGAYTDSTRENDGRGAGGNRLELIDDFSAAEVRQHEISKDEVNPSAFHCFDGKRGVRACNDTVTPGLKHDLPDGESAFVFVNAENRALGLHSTY